MSTGRFGWIAVLVGALSPGLAQAAPYEGLVSGDAWLNEAVLQYREPSCVEKFAWINPFMPGVSADQTDSADLRMAAIVGEYDRGMLDRGGWENPYLPPGSAGSPILAVTIGADPGR